MVEDRAELFKVLPAECLGDRLGNSVCNAVGMAEAFAFNEFYSLLFKGNLIQRLNLDISFH